MGRQYWRGGNMLYPVPAVMVSCMRPGERPNIITVAWAGTVCSAPAMLSISVRKERYAHRIIEETGEFAVNLVNKELTFATDYCGVRSGRDVDKFREMKLTEQPSKYISAPGIAESPLILECKVKQQIPLGTHDMFLAEVVGVSVDERYIDEKGTFHLNDAKLTAYSHGTYFELGEALGTFGFSVRKDKNKKDTKNTKGTKEIKNTKDAKDKRDIRMSSGKNGSGKPDFRKPAKKYADRRKIK
ncbi:flavin reductase family protein [Brotaphodocola catenula]|uniref:Flavin reductase family protein n=1 Tax=Brotaphodocola catenula TaxID=2885361 RepID=A0AAE3ARQ3_9FIRM|nr:flavin reductase family protein [Brotaphodocola catenula]MCC2164097.1 flavin reductase family protein [Brotaphodocola catenula]